jgi:fructose-1,6-bisphosphatase/inositol monophosphatase family enzyme
MRPAHDQLPALLRAVADAVILPRFRALTPSQIIAKGGRSDVVTIADLEAEQRLTEALETLEPGSTVVGEEGVAADPARLAALAESRPVWLVDPVDGTQNFAAGTSCFAVIVAYCRGGETLAGWILDPLDGSVVGARRGEGAWLDGPTGRRPLVIERGDDIATMAGRLDYRHFRRLRGMREQGLSPLPGRPVRYGSTGREYMDIARGTLHFAQYRRLKPWDHAAGILIVEEAGGHALMQGTRLPYRPEPAIVEGTVLLAPSAAAWAELDRLFPAT